MVFVADRIHPELRRIVEFLNEQMRPAEVLAIEVAQFTAGSTRLLAPTLIGATERAAAAKAVTRPSPRSMRKAGSRPFGSGRARKPRVTQVSCSRGLRSEASSLA